MEKKHIFDLTGVKESILFWTLELIFIILTIVMYWWIGFNKDALYESTNSNIPVWGVVLDSEKEINQEIIPTSNVITFVSLVAYGIDASDSGELVLQLMDENNNEVIRKGVPVTSLIPGEYSDISIKKKVHQGTMYKLNVSYNGTNTIVIGTCKEQDNLQNVRSFKLNSDYMQDADLDMVNMMMRFSYGHVPTKISCVLFVFITMLFSISLFKVKIKIQKQKRTIDKKIVINAGIFAIMTDVLVWQIVLTKVLYSFIYKQMGFNYNVFCYMLLLLVFTLVFILLIQFQKHGLVIEGKTNSKLCFFILVMGLNVFTLADSYLKEKFQFGYLGGWEDICSISFVRITLLLILLFTAIYIKSNDNKNHSICVFGAYFFVTAISGFLLYSPNYFVGDVFHADAVFNSIYNVLYGTPYTITSSCIYGHYALLMYLPIKLLGGTYTAFNIVMASIGILQTILLLYAIHKLIFNWWLRILSAFAILQIYIYGMGQNYWQLTPIRTIFFAAFLALAVKWIKSNYSIKIEKLGFVLGIFAIIWNLESGMVLSLGWCGMIFYKELQENANMKNLLKSLIKKVLVIFGMFLAAYGTVELYNWFCSGKGYGIRIFIYPYTSSEYVVSELTCGFSVLNSAYFYTFALIGSCMVYCYGSLVLKNSKNISNESLIFFLVISMLGYLTYYINRPAFSNLRIVFLPCLFVLILSTNKFFDKNITFKGVKELELEKLGKCIIGLSTFAIICALSTLNLALVKNDIQVRYENKTYDAKIFENYCNEFAQNLTDDTVAYGLGTTEIFSNLKRDTGCQSTDFPDMNDISMDRIKVISEKANRVLYAQNTSEGEELIGYKIKNCVLPTVQSTRNIHYWFYEKK